MLEKISKTLKGKRKPKDFGNKVSNRLKGKNKSSTHLSESKKNSGHKILQYSLSGEYIKTWSNIDTVAKTLKVSRESIAGCCRGKSKTAHGFIWRYNGSIIPKPSSRRSDTKVVLKMLGNIIIQEFTSVADAAYSVKANESNISACCRGKCKTIKGFNWKYKEDLI